MQAMSFRPILFMQVVLILYNYIKYCLNQRSKRSPRVFDGWVKVQVKEYTFREAV